MRHCAGELAATTTAYSSDAGPLPRDERLAWLDTECPFSPSDSLSVIRGGLPIGVIADALIADIDEEPFR